MDGAHLSAPGSFPFSIPFQNLEIGLFSLYLKGEQKGVVFAGLSGRKKRKPFFLC
jgi:hypothetical protein